MLRVFYDVGTKFLNIIQLNFVLQESKEWTNLDYVM